MLKWSYVERQARKYDVGRFNAPTGVGRVSFVYANTMPVRYAYRQIIDSNAVSVAAVREIKGGREILLVKAHASARAQPAGGRAVLIRRAGIDGLRVNFFARR